MKRAFEKLFCMNVHIHKENYSAYRERRIIMENQQKIMAQLNMPSPPPEHTIEPPVAYKNWNNRHVDWDHFVPEDDEIETGSEAEEVDSEATESE